MPIKGLRLTVFSILLALWRLIRNVAVEKEPPPEEGIGGR
jgi:hypothetical protein